MTSVPSPSPDAVMERRVVAVLIGVVAEVALVAALAHAAWSPSDADNIRTLSAEEGIETIAIFGTPAALLILGACCLVAFQRRRWGAAGSTVVLAMAGVAGFLGYALISFSRVEMSDC